MGFWTFFLSNFQFPKKLSRKKNVENLHIFFKLLLYLLYIHRNRPNLYEFIYAEQQVYVFPATGFPTHPPDS
jgi:hypothetical protein